MAIRLADTARPNNYVDAEHLGTFPVAYAEDVWFADGTRLSEKTFDGQSIQKEELPLASADELGNIYQYVGETGTYTKGYFYECVSDGKPSPTYSWKVVISAGDSIQKESLPVASEDELGNIYQYVGVTDANYINGYFYKCVSDGGVTPVYSWEKIQVSDGGDTIQVETLPTASADELGNIYEFVGTTTANYINGRFYRCVSDGASTPTYAWEEVDFGDSTPHWSGTRAEYEAIKDTLEAGTYVSITDDYDEGLEVVDVIENGNMNPVTSNAVAGAIQIPQPYWTAKVQAWAIGDVDVIFTAPTGKKFIFGTGSVLDDRRAFVTVMDEAPIVSADGKTITIKFYTYSLGGAQSPTQCTVYLNALVIDE